MRRFLIDWPATGAILITTVCWSAVPVFLKHFTHSIDAWTANGTRYPLSAVVLLPLLIVAVRRGTCEASIFRRALLPAFVNTCGQVLWALSPYYLDASLFSFLIRCSIIWALVLTFILFPRERVLARSRRFWVGLMLAIGGFVGMTLLGEPLRWATTGKGVLIILLCSLFFSTYGVSIRLKMKQDHPMIAFAVISFYTSVVLFVLMLTVGHPGDIRAMDGGQLVLLAVSSLTGIALGHCCYYFAIKRIGVLIPASAGLLSPFVTVVMAFIFLPSERLTVWQWASGIAACGGSALLLWAQDRIHHEDQRRALEARGPDDGSHGPTDVGGDALVPESARSTVVAESAPG